MGVSNEDWYRQNVKILPICGINIVNYAVYAKSCHSARLLKERNNRRVGLANTNERDRFDEIQQPGERFPCFVSHFKFAVHA
jgi:hypothetical protein